MQRLPSVAFACGMPKTNKLYFGDNLDVLREYIPDESVDLIYLDPPFNSQAQYNVLFQSPKEDAVSAQAQAFRDTWIWGDEAEWAYKEIMRNGGKVARLIDALRSALDESDMMAYLVMMAVRLRALHLKLKPTGSLYLHCDPTASHYLKVLLDAIFGAENFLSEVIWKRTGTHSSARRWGPVHDVIFVFARAVGQQVWNRPYVAHSEKHLATHYRKMDEEGRRYEHGELTGPGTRRGKSGDLWRGFDVTSIGRHWVTTVDRLEGMYEEGRIYILPDGGWPRVIRYEDESKGRAVGDIWDDIPPINMRARERIGYPTQKPIALLDRIILASSNPGDTVLDPFCGCGTTIEAAERLGRQWVGIDVAVHAVKVIEARIAERLGESVRYTIEGMPRDFESAVKLAERDKYQFQWWANYLFNPHALREQKKGADRGIDGELFFPNGPGRPWGRMLTSVKGGDQVGPAAVREFARVLEREKAELGLFICLYPPTREMTKEAASAGHGDVVHGDIPKLQIVPIQKWFQGKLPLLPPLEHLPSAAFSLRQRRVPATARPDVEQPELPFTFVGGRRERGTVRHLNPGMVRQSA
jgi:adenine specific DNA methylase Mod